MLFPYHPTTITLPEGFLPRHQWAEYMPEYDIDQMLRPQRVEHEPQGRRWGRWPLYFEEYISDTEPNPAAPEINLGAPTRIVRWQRVSRTDIPPGWKQLSRKPYHIEGFVDISNIKNYVQNWSKTTRQAYKKWQLLEQQDFSIIPLTYSDFAQAYKGSSAAKHTLGDSIHPIRNKVEHGNTNITMWGVMHQNKIIAGMSVLTSPSQHASYYSCGFIHPKAAEVPAMVGLMHHWHTEVAAQGVRFLHFGLFWCPGRQKNWKGFSEFKSKFGLTYIVYPPALYQLQKKQHASAI